MKRLLSLFMLLPLLARAATGDITGAAVETNGWQLLVWVDGLATNGTYSLGLTSTNKRPENAQVTVRITSSGYDATGAAVSRDLRLWGTEAVRMPYPNQAYLDNIIESGRVKLRIALSDPVYSGDTAITATIASGIYSGGGSSLSATSITVTNNSALSPGIPVAKWVDVPWEYCSGNTVTGRLQAFGPYPTNGQPVAAVAMWAYDGSTYSATTLVTSATVDLAYGDASKVVEHLGAINVSTLANNTAITLRARIYPWRGTAITTESSGATFPTAEFCPWPKFLSKDDSYARWAAVVSSSGNDTSGALVSAPAFSSGSPPSAFLTIGGAVNRMISSNSTHHSRSEIGGSVIYLRSGNHMLSGATHSAIVMPVAWVTVEGFPGDSSVVLTNNSLTRNAGQLTRLSNLTIGATSYVLDNAWAGWFDQCLFADTNTTLRTVDTVTNVFYTRCTFVRNDAPSGYGTQPTTVWMWRGCNWDQWMGTAGNKSLHSHCFTGNSRSGPPQDPLDYGLTLVSSSLAGVVPSTHPFITYNRWQNHNPSSDLIQISNGGASEYATNGFAVVGNVVEFTGTLSQTRIASICSSSQVVNDVPQDHAYVWHNTFVGQRVNFGENAGGDPGVSASRNHWSVLNNLFDQVNTKHDTEYNPSGARTGGWPILYGVGWHGNTDLAPPIDNGWYFNHIGSPGFDFGKVVGGWTGGGWTNYNKFAFRGSYLADSQPAIGNGDYRLKSDAPVITQLAGSVWCLPRDLEGAYRGLGDPPGAYAAGNAKRGSFF